MYAFAVVGDDAEAALERLLPELDGRVGTVRLERTRTDGSVSVARGDTEYVLGDGWRAAGAELSLQDALDRLAPDHEYAAVLGAREPDLPRIVVGGDSDGTWADPGEEKEGVGEKGEEGEKKKEGVGEKGKEGAGAGVRTGEKEAEVLAAADGVADLDVEAAVEAIRATEPHETLESLVAALKRSPAAEYAGAIATFTGRVRAKENDDDDRTRYLEFEKYEGVAESRMERIEEELAARDGVLEVGLHHRTGRVADGEDIVFVVVLAGHREEAFRAVEDGIDRLKAEVPLFKKEVTASDTFWVHEREE